MSTKLATVVAAFAVALLAGVAGPAFPAEPAPVVQIDPADYPTLDDKELGHIRRFVKLSRQFPGDWGGMSDDFWLIAERTQQFQLAYMSAALGLVQHQYTPAYRELYRDTMDRLIQKMTLPDIWESWLASSRAGTSAADPTAEDLTSGWVDPMRKYNIMLKGYLLQAGALYAMLYRDGKYDRPDAFTFNYVPNTWGNGPVTFRYSLPDLAKIVYQEYVDQNYEGVLCEPNRLFVACNQPPILGLINYDQVYGTGYAADVIPKFRAAWVRKGYTIAETKQFVDMMYVKQGSYRGPGGPVLDGWTGAWLNAWNPDYMKSVYPAQKARYVPMMLTGDYARRVPPHTKGMLSLGFGQIAFMAAEVGDRESRDRLLAYADRNFNPVWEEGTYYYPRNDDYQTDENGNSRGVGSWTGNVLLALARLDEGDGFLKLYREPWGKAELEAPQVTDVDYLSTNVSQAYYDPTKDALIVTVKPGPVKAANVSFVVRNLPARTYTVIKDGAKLGTISGNTAQAGSDISWRADGALSVSTDLSAARSFVFVGNGKTTVARVTP